MKEEIKILFSKMDWLPYRSNRRPVEHSIGYMPKIPHFENVIPYGHYTQIWCWGKGDYLALLLSQNPKLLF